MAKKTKVNALPGTPVALRKEIAAILRGLAGRRDLHRIFSDWIETYAIALSNAVDKAQYETREARYMQIVKDYTREELGDRRKFGGQAAIAFG